MIYEDLWVKSCGAIMRARRWKRVRLRAVKQTIDIKDEASINQRVVNEQARRQRCRKSSGWSSTKKRRGLMFATFIYNGRGPHLALTATAAHTGWPHTCTDNCAQLDISFIPLPPTCLPSCFVSARREPDVDLFLNTIVVFPFWALEKVWN